MARTVVRHPRNRLILAAYLSLALGYTLGDVAELVRRGAWQLYTPSAGVVAVSLVLVFFTLLGMRVLFTIPVELKANWLFRITEGCQVAGYRAGARRAMFWLGAAPICACALLAYALLWGWYYAALHTAMLLLVSLLLIAILTHGFIKIPFTCSFLPGRASLKTRLGAWAIVFSFTTLALTHLEVVLLFHPQLYAFVFAAGCAALALLAADRRSFDRRQPGMVYEESGETVLRLGLAG